MSLILNLHTATETAMISLAENSTVIGSSVNTHQKDHASFLQPAIKQLLQQSGSAFKDICAVAVTAGPGSYTGLRVGMASAKGLCYGLKIPLIALNTLEVMALSAIAYYPSGTEQIFYCPMIDARRMEIFTAVYDKDLNEILSPCAMILANHSMEDLLQTRKIIYFGSGSDKSKSVIKNKNALFIESEISNEAMAALSYQKFINNQFANTAYAEPLYIKDFYTIINQ